MTAELTLSPVDHETPNLRVVGSKPTLGDVAWKKKTKKQQAKQKLPVHCETFLSSESKNTGLHLKSLTHVA